MIRSRCFYVLAVVSCIFGRASVAGEFSEVRVAGKRVTVCTVNLQAERIELFLRDDSGQPFKSFERVERYLRERGEKLAFAMNAGMFHRDLSPVGLFVAKGKQVAPLNTNSGYGNFFMKPNGVFLISHSGPQIVETSEYPKLTNRVVLATQSGPLLVHAGRIHTRFSTNSTSRVVRNGVGVSRSGKIVFAISEDAVSLYEFAMMFRDLLDCPNALYLDGVVSGLYAPDLKRSDKKSEFGPIVGVVESWRERKE
jgi:uncharacterized protein YigE (DUF2233 family)